MNPQDAKSSMHCISQTSKSLEACTASFLPPPVVVIARKELVGIVAHQLLLICAGLRVVQRRSASTTSWAPSW
jgi:hypothetical protein